MVPFAGYEMPVQYQGVIDETKTCRKTGGLFDVSHMGQFFIRGKNPLSGLQKLVTNHLGKVQLHQAQYNLICNPSGGVIDDIIVYYRAPEELFLCVNASNRKTDFDWLKSHLPTSLNLEDVSDHTALIAVQGPRAEDLLKKLSPSQAIEHLKYYWGCELTLNGVSVYLSRTGYTGEDGFEIYLPNSDASNIWEVLLSEGKALGIAPCGLGARDTLRLEMGYPLHGHEISPEITPLQAGLGWVVKTEQVDNFIGKEALVQEKLRGPAQILRAFIIQDKRIARQNYPILNQRKEAVGTITSGTFSPHLNAPIALGFVNSRFQKETHFQIKVREDLISAQTMSLPFVPSRTKKASN